MRAQFLDLLKDIGFLPRDVNVNNVALRYENRNGGDRGMLGAVLCAGLAPNILQIPYTSRAVMTGNMTKKIAEIGLLSRKGMLNKSVSISQRMWIDIPLRSICITYRSKGTDADDVSFFRLSRLYPFPIHDI